ncbi:hypothetical protein ACX1DX_12655 [Tessaracoccus sp. Y36]
MHITSPTLRWTTALTLALAALTTCASLPFGPNFAGPPATWLAEIAVTPAAGWSFHLFTISQLFLAAGVVGIAAQTWQRAPRLTFVATALIALSAFAHGVGGGVQIMLLTFAPHTELHDEVGPVIEAMYSSPHLVPYLAFGMLGLVLGMILFGVMLLRARFGPRWLGVEPILFVVAEFGLSSLSEWAFYAAGLLFGVTLVGLAVVTLRGTLDDRADGDGVVRGAEDASRQILDPLEARRA